ncbi:unnamed protein product [Vitrella brassicaformis CCMP3155]|uniref:Uncharacterized protein n=1 Tax=Vitrella brassicaformis (strain CCMP3155) TaxID=1169540 RepID=A0A0G4EDY8_VITBC|nr:unnamed protein product [Vitrella brassicaformis CCMP3155]|eukprot:CEL93964.1 unnamed protein product [Vitrella brassicaformis CCMP3155]
MSVLELAAREDGGLDDLLAAAATSIDPIVHEIHKALRQTKGRQREIQDARLSGLPQRGIVPTGRDALRRLMEEELRKDGAGDEQIRRLMRRTAGSGDGVLAGNSSSSTITKPDLLRLFHRMHLRLVLLNSTDPSLLPSIRQSAIRDRQSDSAAPMEIDAGATGSPSCLTGEQQQRLIRQLCRQMVRLHWPDPTTHSEEAAIAAPQAPVPSPPAKEDQATSAGPADSSGVYFASMEWHDDVLEGLIEQSARLASITGMDDGIPSASASPSTSTSQPPFLAALRRVTSEIILLLLCHFLTLPAITSGRPVRRLVLSMTGSFQVLRDHIQKLKQRAGENVSGRMRWLELVWGVAQRHLQMVPFDVIWLLVKAIVKSGPAALHVDGFMVLISLHICGGCCCRCRNLPHIDPADSSHCLIRLARVAQCIWESFVQSLMLRDEPATVCYLLLLRYVLARPRGPPELRSDFLPRFQRFSDRSLPACSSMQLKFPRADLAVSLVDAGEEWPGGRKEEERGAGRKKKKTPAGAVAAAAAAAAERPSCEHTFCPSHECNISRTILQRVSGQASQSPLSPPPPNIPLIWPLNHHQQQHQQRQKRMPSAVEPRVLAAMKESTDSYAALLLFVLTTGDQQLHAFGQMLTTTEGPAQDAAHGDVADLVAGCVSMSVGVGMGDGEEEGGEGRASGVRPVELSQGGRDGGPVSPGERMKTDLIMALRRLVDVEIERLLVRYDSCVFGHILAKMGGLQSSSAVRKGLVAVKKAADEQARKLPGEQERKPDPFADLIRRGDAAAAAAAAGGGAAAASVPPSRPAWPMFPSRLAPQVQQRQRQQNVARSAQHNPAAMDLTGDDQQLQGSPDVIELD